jgi:pimeloyl-ACP methyl ester carboxylesterase
LGKEVHILFRLATLPILGEYPIRPDRSRIEELLETCVHDPAVIDDEMVDYYYQLAEQPGAQQAFLATVRALGSLSGARDMTFGPILRGLGRIDLPTLIIWGKEDEIIPLEHAYTAQERMPDARLKVIEDCGHLPQIENPDAFNEILLDFLEEPGLRRVIEELS